MFRVLNSKKRFIEQFSVLAICLTCADCQKPAAHPSVDFVRRSDVFEVQNSFRRDDLRLVIEIGGSGKVKLNKIETGAVSDLSLLTEKLEVIFADRKRAGISARETIVDPSEDIKSRDLEKIIEALANAGASPILIVKNDL